MRNFPTIFERAKAYEEGYNGEIAPSTNIVINTNRLWYGKDSTVSAFIATAYDKDGNNVASMEGYFLEPGTNYDKAEIAGSDSSIKYGTYNIVRGQKWQRFEWYVDNVPGRSGIAIHGGTDGSNTLGCLLPAEDFVHDKEKDNYRTVNSGKKKKELFDFFKKYGKNGIKINVGI
ncbi:MAG: hypothetical protein IKV07_05885 [Bacteroidaceae bacterium]|nr:hypothetical protein [Bacteroidaceae bacterium]